MAPREEQLDTLERAIRAMRDKIEEQTPLYETAELAQTVTLGTGEMVIRPNPFVAEYRALVKDYGLAIKAYRDLSNGNDAAMSALDDLRKKFQVVK